MDATDVGPGPTPGAPPPPGSPTGGPGPRRLRRRPDEGHIAGVCAGVAEYFNVDPVIVRIAAVVLAFSGPGLGAYILAWIFVPAAHGPVPHGASQAPIDRKDRGTQIFGIVLLALAVSLIWGDWWSPARRWMFPIGLIALGAWLLLRRDRDDEDEVASPVPPSPAWTGGGWATAVSTPVSEPDASDDDTTTVATDPLDGDARTLDDPSAAEPTDEDVTMVVDDPTTTQPLDGAATDGPPRPPWDVPPPPIPPEPPNGLHDSHGWHGWHGPNGRRSRRRRILGPIVFGTLLIWAGVAWLAGLSVETSLAGGLLIIGTGFILGSFVGGSRSLILPALIVGAALCVTAAVDIPLNGPIGDQRWAPQTIDDLEGRYEVSIGEGTLDLTSVELASDDRIALEASVGIGHLVLLVSDDVTVEVATKVGAGESKVLGLTQNGVGISADQRDEAGSDSGTFVLDLQVGMGQIEVRREAGPTTTTTTTTRELG